MTLFTQPRMKALIDALAEGKSMSKATALAYGSKSKIGWTHLRNAKIDRENGVPMEESKYCLRDWPVENEHHWLDHAYQMAQQIAKLDFHLETLEEIRQSTRPVIEGGRVQYEIDEKLIAEYKDAAEAESFGVEDFPFRHDENGARIPLRVRDRVGNQLTLAALKAIAGETWNTEQKVVVDHKKNLGVLVLGQRPQQQKPSSPIRDDMQARLAHIRSHPDRASARPSAPVDLGAGGRAAGDPAEHVSNGMGDDVQPEFPTNPVTDRILAEMREPPKPEPTVTYARPRRTNALDAVDRPGTNPMPGGGFVRGSDGRWRPT